MEHGHDHGSTLTGKRLALSIFMTCAFVVGEAIAGYFAQLAGASPPGLHKDGEKGCFLRLIQVWSDSLRLDSVVLSLQSCVIS